MNYTDNVYWTIYQIMRFNKWIEFKNIKEKLIMDDFSPFIGLTIDGSCEYVQSMLKVEGKTHN